MPSRRWVVFLSLLASRLPELVSSSTRRRCSGSRKPTSFVRAGFVRPVSVSFRIPANRVFAAGPARALPCARSTRQRCVLAAASVGSKSFAALPLLARTDAFLSVRGQTFAVPRKVSSFQSRATRALHGLLVSHLPSIQVCAPCHSCSGELADARLWHRRTRRARLGISRTRRDKCTWSRRKWEVCSRSRRCSAALRRCSLHSPWRVVRSRYPGFLSYADRPSRAEIVGVRGALVAFGHSAVELPRTVFTIVANPVDATNREEGQRRDGGVELDYFTHLYFCSTLCPRSAAVLVALRAQGGPTPMHTTRASRRRLDMACFAPGDILLRPLFVCSSTLR